MTKVLVGMSGGIDSSVVAYLLKEQGFDVQGVTMSVWKKDDRYKGDPSKHACFSPDSRNVDEARAICEKIGIPHIALDISDLYEQVVLRNFREEYLNGRTPNPCVWCNQKIKFGAMVDEARRAGIEFDYFATGHYARIVNENGRFAIKRGYDTIKDQSYFLYRLSQKQLSQIMFPLGGLSKAEVRAIDRAQGFHPADMDESQDFYSGHYTDLLDVSPKEGEIVDTDGKVLGKHQGMWNYTVGQRKGLGIAAPYPLYVVSLDPVNNRVIVGYEDKVVHTRVTASNIVWGAVDHIDSRLDCKAKIRSTGFPIDCTIYVDEFDRLCAEFKTPVKAATCGQSLVVYRDDVVLCGGIIDSTGGKQWK